MKKFFAILLTVILCTSLCVPAFAVDIEVTNTVNNVSVFAHGVSYNLEHKHTFKSQTVTEATCLQNGIIENICIECGYMTSVSIPALGHNIYKSDKYIAPTCCNNGFYGGVVCLRCGVVFVNPEVIPATGHVYSKTIDVCDICGCDRNSAAEAGAYRTTGYERRNVLDRLLEIFRALFG